MGHKVDLLHWHRLGWQPSGSRPPETDSAACKMFVGMYHKSCLVLYTAPTLLHSDTDLNAEMYHHFRKGSSSAAPLHIICSDYSVGGGVAVREETEGERKTACIGIGWFTYCGEDLFISCYISHPVIGIRRKSSSERTV